MVDDNRMLNRFLVAFLRSKGHDCHALSDGTKALQWLALNRCDAVVLDIGMPKLDGLSLLRAIRENHPCLPVVIFTGMGYDDELMREALAAGASAYASKGLGPGEVYAAMLRVVYEREGAYA